MSNLIPSNTVISLRNAVDKILNYYGIDCTLYIPKNISYNEAEKLDIYLADSDLQYDAYETKVFLDFSPDIRKLRKLGLFTENTIPIVAKFGRYATPIGQTQPIEVDIPRKSWFVISTEHLSGQNDITEFEVVDVVLLEFHDKIIWQERLVAPRRLKENI